ncbi:MAG: sulfatase-like hydrolase/transferase [Planctomycetaceae bacterium]|nr:sulfatase-like hydrolase/transferase [Planctomycetaceae bacterium]
MNFVQRKFLINSLTVLVIVVALGNAALLHADSPPRPNILLIVADDLGYGELGCYGGKEIPTPHLDALAASGLQFTNGYVTAPYCAASRAGLLTGRYQTEFGFEFNPIGAKNEDPAIGLPENQKTIGDHLQRAGYVTGLIGKWHLGGTAAYHPLRRGFDEFYGFTHEGHYFAAPPYDNHTTWLRKLALPDGSSGRWTSQDGRTLWTTHMGHAEPDYDANNPILRHSQPVEQFGNLTETFTSEACEFIERNREQPFFLYLAYNAVHSPLQGRDDYMQRAAHIEDIQRRIFAAMLMQLDDGIGRVRETLKQHDLEQNTLVFFLSDNGGPTRELTSSNAPLRDGKGNVYEGGLRVPFLMSWPAEIKQSGVVDTPIITTDILPTVMTAVQGDYTSSTGINLLEHAQIQKPRTFYWRLGNRQALRRGKWKLVRDKRKSTEWELYDLDNDLSETSNIASSQPDLVAELAHAWDEWSAKQADPAW